MNELPALTQLRLMAIALIQEGTGDLAPEFEEEFAHFERNGLPWREYTINQINGQTLPAEFILAAIHKKWKDSRHKNKELFTRQILSEWGFL